MSASEPAERGSRTDRSGRNVLLVVFAVAAAEVCVLAWLWFRNGGS